MFNATTKITKHGIHVLSGDTEINAAGLVITVDHIRNGYACFKVQLVDEYGNAIVEIAKGDLSDGEMLTMLRLDQPFNVQIGSA